jgi:hypothetical protein
VAVDEASTRVTTSTRSRVAAGPAASRVEDLVTVLFGACLVGGALTDAWAHTNIIDELESFFTPWHALFYGGFAATAAWTFWLGYRRRGAGRPWWRSGWPAGYALGALGAVIFMVSGVVDLAWHSAFGIENGLDAGFSPSHIGLVLGATLLLTSPLRSWWASGSDRSRAATGVASLALGTVFATILLSSSMVMLSAAPTHVYDHVLNSPSHVETAFGLSKYLMTTVLLLVPVLLAYRRRAVFGTATAVVGTVVLFDLTQAEFPPAVSLAGLAATLGAAVFDLAVTRLDAVRGADAPLRLPVAGALFATLVWSGHLLGLQIAAGLRWPPELWVGSVVMAAFLGAALGALAGRPHPQPDLRLG